MATTPPQAPDKRDRRGTPPGDQSKPEGRRREGTEWEGRSGNLPFQATDEMRMKVRTLAKTMRHEMPMPRKWIAAQMGISVATLDRHFEEDMNAGRAEVVASLGAILIGVALGTIKNISPEQLDAIKFALPRIGCWSTKVEVSGPDGRPVERIDLSGMSFAALREYGRNAAIAQGLDPDVVVGPSLSDDG